MEWLSVDTLPAPGKRPGRCFVIVEGWKWHGASYRFWRRADIGIARTDNEGFHAADIARIEDLGDMDSGTGRVTYWAAIPKLPKFAWKELRSDDTPAS